MPLEIAVGGVGVVGVLAYALLGGADFGGGVWSALAAGPRKAAQREAIRTAMGPVWEANHVWLIFVIVVMFTAFPPAYAALSVALYIPFHLVLLGIILRGSAFAFRSHSHGSSHGVRGRSERHWGRVFGVASVITPVLLGMCLGAVSDGGIRVRAGVVTMPGGPAWLSPLAIGMGALALALCAYLAAVYLVNETSGELRQDFLRRAIAAEGVAVVLALALLPLAYAEAPHLWAGLMAPRTLPALLAGAALTVMAGAALRQASVRLARIAAVGQVACVVGGWALAQYPFIVYPDMSVTDAAGPASTLRFVLYSLPFGLAILLPSLWWLFRVFKGEYLGLTERTPEGMALADGGEVRRGDGPRGGR